MKQKFTINQKVLWIFRENGQRTVINATIIEVYAEHVIALSEDNDRLWIDEDNEMEFFDYEMNSKIYGIK